MAAAAAAAVCSLHFTAYCSLCHLVCCCLLFAKFRLLFDFNCKMDHKSNGQSYKVTHPIHRGRATEARKRLRIGQIEFASSKQTERISQLRFQIQLHFELAIESNYHMPEKRRKGLIPAKDSESRSRGNQFAIVGGSSYSIF